MRIDFDFISTLFAGSALALTFYFISLNFVP